MRCSHWRGATGRSLHADRCRRGRPLADHATQAGGDGCQSGRPLPRSVRSGQRGPQARFEIPKFAAIRTHHVSTALSQGSPFCSLIFKCPAWEARSLPELQRRHGQICEWSLHQAPFDQVRMQRFSRSPTKPLTWLDCYRRCVNWDCRIGQIHQTRAARISMRLIG